jgi:2-C-methyl-D-erythritol 4-phosphate cytidylyltransferase
MSSLDIRITESLSNKVGIVFGSSQGIGKAIMDYAKEHNLKVYGFSKSQGCDVSNPRDVVKALNFVYEKEARIDYIIVTAGILIRKPLFSQSYGEILNQINTNYLGSIVVAKEAFPFLKESQGHLVLFTSSSYTRGRSLYTIYSSTKAAIVNFAQGLAEEWESYGIKVNTICPERTATPMRFRNFGNEPLDTLLSPDKVAYETLKVVASDITGQVVEVKR